MKLKAYHISPKRNRESIKTHGLIPQEKLSGRIQYGPRLFFSTNTNDLGFDFVNFENVDCWEFEVEAEKIKPDLISGSTNHFYIEQNITPEDIKLFRSY